MKKLATALACAAMLVAGGAVAQDKKDAKTADVKKMTMQECKDYMAMAQKDAKTKDAKKDTMCADVMKADKKDAPKK
ncbi:MAG TPA: hypothetical protein VNE58_09650 [Casimicrobiaceae bacterium]|nr:hypothetical protein [Casimicrobiaceae bacterium]